MFIHLHLHSAYSLAEGALKIKKIPELCHQHRMPAVALTDTANLFGALEFAVTCAAEGIQPLIGCQLSVERPSFAPKGSNKGSQSHPLDPFQAPETSYFSPDQLVLLAQSEKGYKNLLRLVSHAYLKTDGKSNEITNKKTNGKAESASGATVTLEDCALYQEGLIALTGGFSGGISRLLNEGKIDAARAYLTDLHHIYGDRLYVELMRHGLPQEDKTETTLLEFAFEKNIPLVATNDVYFATPELFEAHDALLCIAAGAYVAQENRRSVSKEHYFKSSKEMAALFQDLPEAIANTQVIAKRCSYMPCFSKPLLPLYPTSSGHSEGEELRLQAEAGLKEKLSRYTSSESPDPQEYLDRLHYELDIIEKMGFSGYFLIVADFIQWAKKQGIPVGPGRGSGAGSLVAWSLTITDIDPIRFGLIFERFLNPERVSMPDFDVDFCQDRRDEVIHYVQDKYGSDRVAHIITFGKLQARAVLRDVGRVLQMPYGQIDKICKLIPNNPAHPLSLKEAVLAEPQLYESKQSDPAVAKLIDIGTKLEGLYRHASTHAAGIVISDRPLIEIIPLYKDERSSLPVTQFNMKYVEAAGLLKFDFLGLTTLTVIEKCCQMIRKKGLSIDISAIPLDDKPTLDLLCRVEAVGVFQVESAGMRDVLRRLQPDRFEDLVALVALYRPGPMDDIPRYLACKHGEESVTYLHPALEAILGPTYGVMVYQEQVMKIAQVLGGYSLGAADLLRRAMGKKIKSEMDAQRAQFVNGAIKGGVSEEIAHQLFDLMAKFAGYGFNKSHAAPYALLTYQTAYLKANHPREFFAATMTCALNNTDKLMIYHQDFQKYQMPLLPPSVNDSDVFFSVEGTGVRYALAAIKNVGEGAMTQLVHERQTRGPFKNLTDFASRMDPRTLNKRQLENLIAAGALDCLINTSVSFTRRQLYEGIDSVLRYAHQVQSQAQSQQRSLFGTIAATQEELVVPPIPEWDPLEKLQNEFNALGFFLSSHPLDIFEASLEKLGIISSHLLLDQKNGTLLRMAGIILEIHQRVAKSGQKYAFIQLSDNKGVYEVAIFSEAYREHFPKLLVGKPLLLSVSYKKEEESYRLIVQDVSELDRVFSEAKDLRCCITDLFDWQHFSRLLQDIPSGNTRLLLEITLSSQKKVRITLLQKHTFKASHRAVLREVRGVVSVV